jgi:hypothetical protein
MVTFIAVICANSREGGSRIVKQCGNYITTQDLHYSTGKCIKAADKTENSVPH